MITYTGYAEEYGIRLALIGDGVASRVEINLTRAPLSLKFTNDYPTGVFVRVEDGVKPSSITLAAAKMTLQFSEALPEPNPGTLSPRTQLFIWLLYGG